MAGTAQGIVASFTICKYMELGGSNGLCYKFLRCLAWKSFVFHLSMGKEKLIGLAEEVDPVTIF